MDDQPQKNTQTPAKRRPGRPPKIKFDENGCIRRPYEKFDLKSQLTAKELLFLENYLEGGETIDSAMVNSGYGNLTQKWRYKLAAKIVRKYEAQAADHREVFQAIGCGQVRVAQKIHASIDTAESERVQLGYTQMAARALGMMGDVVQAGQGLTVIIQAQGDAQTQINVAGEGPSPTDPGYQHPAGTPGKPIQITK